jgi:hypothetical protein
VSFIDASEPIIALILPPKCIASWHGLHTAIRFRKESCDGYHR